MLKSAVKGTSDFLSDMPGWFFWSFLFILTWTLTLTKIINLDLWWHLACGKFFVENGFYPPTGTFTFSPVNPTTSNIKTWFGDIVFYLVYFAGRETGLQVFRVVMTAVPLCLAALIARKKYNLWLVAFGLLLISGTLQMQLLRNSIFILLFMPLIMGIWWYIKKKNKPKYYYLVLLYIPIMGLWSIMHGYALVGCYIVFIIFIGDVLDGVIRKSSHRLFKTGIFLVAVVCMAFVVNLNLSLGLKHTVVSFWGSLSDHPSQGTETIRPDSKDEAGTAVGNLIKTIAAKPEVKDGIHPGQLLKNASRFLLKGGDVGFVGEYAYPFDYPNLLFVRALKVLIAIFVLYLGVAACYAPRHLRFSFILPSLASLLIGMGYIRTVGLPFLVAGPVLLSGIMEMSATARQSLPKMFLKVPADYINVGLLSLLLFFFCLSNYFVFTNNFVAFTGIISGEPGFGRADRHKSRVPEYVLEHYPDEEMYNSYNIGSLLIWEWYGKKKVFIDGRSVTYKKQFYDDYKYSFSLNSFENMDIRHAILGISDDFDWFENYLRLNWDIEAFDTGMLLLKRRVKEGYDNFYGNVPQFIGNIDDFRRLQRDSKVRFGRFVNIMVKYMLIFGRLEDASKLYHSLEPIINALPDGINKKVLHNKKRLMDDVQEEFGLQNRTVLVDLFKEIFLDDKDDRRDAKLANEQSPVTIHTAFANAHFKLGNKKMGVDHLSVAADSDKNNVMLQVRIGDYFYEMKALGPAIKHYKRAVALDPKRVHEYNKLGALYYQKGDLKLARSSFGQAIEADPKVIASYINLAAVLMSQGEFRNALEVNKKGLAVEPENADLLEMKKDLETRQ